MLIGLVGLQAQGQDRDGRGGRADRHLVGGRQDMDADPAHAHERGH